MEYFDFGENILVVFYRNEGVALLFIITTYYQVILSAFKCMVPVFQYSLNYVHQHPISHIEDMCLARYRLLGIYSLCECNPKQHFIFAGTINTNTN